MTDTAPRRHRWPNAGDEGYRSLDGHMYVDGNDRTERSCQICGLIKITVHPPQGFPWREWRTKDGKPWVGYLTPPCAQVAEVKT
jgi:hypothetical protein